MKLSSQITTIVAAVSKLLPKLMDPGNHKPFKIVIESDRQGHVRMDWYKKMEVVDEIVDEEADVMRRVIPENFKYNL